MSRLEYFTHTVSIAYINLLRNDLCMLRCVPAYINNAISKE